MTDEVDDEHAELTGESEIMDFWLRISSEVVKLANELKLSDEDVRRVLNRYQPRDCTLSCGMTALLQEIEIHRRLEVVAAEMRPDEKMVPLVELVERNRKRNGSGEN